MVKISSESVKHKYHDNGNYTIKYKCRTPHKKITVQTVVHTEHAKEREKLIAKALHEKISNAKSEKKISSEKLKKAITKSDILHHKSDLKDFAVAIKKK